MESKNNSVDSQTLVERLVTSDEAAADEVFRRYVRRLTGLARARLAPQVGRRVDPEDAVQSAFRSFFVGARSGRFTIERSGDLWRLLATITARKVSRLTIRHRGAKRSVAREARSNVDASGDLAFLVDHAATAPQAAALADELTAIMRALTTNQRRALQLRLEDASVADIAHEVGCTERTVRRWLHDLQKQFEQRLIEVSDALPVQRSPSTDIGEVDERRTTRTIPDTPKSIASSLTTIDYRDLVFQLHLGMGGMGRVYRAWQRSTDTHVAVKVLKKSRQHQRAAVERFLAEAELIAALDHPGIVRLLGVGRMPAGGYFFTMQLVEGGDLQQRLEQGPQSPTSIAQWMQQAAEAVAHAHERGIIHCDLKPSNLLLDRNDRVVVSDFGFAVALGGKIQALGGTRAYIAPELLEDRKVSERTDVWGLGAVLYALLTNRPPWTNHQSLELDWAAQPPNAATICRRALALDPNDRYQSAAEFLAAVRKLQRDPPDRDGPAI